MARNPERCLCAIERTGRLVAFSARINAAGEVPSASTGTASNPDASGVMGDCQLRKGPGQTRHMYLVFLAHSLLMRQLRQGRASAWALERLTTVGQACRAVCRETLSDTISWVIDRVQQDDWTPKRVMTRLALK